ncbi:hypothetical protein [Nonomuraea sp. NPDC048826]|uniref:hypothetical protein n=1 Tax=Nonomuraea sp. NPDC048826 TaxID=3364347 RepID=UPI00371E756F
MHIVYKRRMYWLAPIVLAVFVPAMVAVVITQRTGPWENYANADRVHLVLVNAFAVSHPGHYVDHWQTPNVEPEIEPDSGRIPLIVSPRSPYVRGTVQSHSKDLSMILGGAGEILIPQLKGSKTSHAISAMSHGGEDVDVTSTALSDISESMLATAVVRLKSPISEEDISADLLAWVDTILFDMQAENGSALISWSRATCDSRGFSDCEQPASSSLTQQFKKWVSLLQEDDAAGLQAFGLNLDELRAHARAGLLEGFVITAHPSILQKIVKDENVQEVRLTDVLLDV